MSAVAPQGSVAWHEQRIGRVTGSRCGAILGLNPYSKPKDVLREMIREHFNVEREFAGNEATEWGNTHEQSAINAYESKTGNMVIEHGLIAHPEHAWIGYSPDGSTASEALIECKCPFSRKIPDEIPAHYYAQVQLGMEVMNLETCDFVYWIPDGVRVTPVDRDRAWFAKALPKLREFFDEYQAALAEPTEHLEPLVKDMTENVEWLDAVAAFKIARQMAVATAAREADCRSELIRLANNKSAKGGGLTLTKVDRVGSIDYSKVPQLTGVDLSEYRKKGSSSFRICVDNE
ncbi:MAG TPA: hypothetical protein EYG22_03945 [Candidatus Thioglobus sp.]|nr:hypothetical protein [Candidatus Thioglobus sp.]